MVKTRNLIGVAARLSLVSLAVLPAAMVAASDGDLARMAVEARKVRETLVEDPLRPHYHLVPADARPLPRDKDRAAFQDGRYHLWFTVEHAGTKALDHFSSIDLVHWRCHPADDSAAPASGSLRLEDGTARQIEWTWIEPGTASASAAAAAATQSAAGASAALSLPRLVTEANGVRGIAPAPEVEKLRIRRATADEVSVTSGAPVVLAGIAGRACELQLELEPSGANRFGVQVLRSRDGKTRAAVVYNPAGERLTLEVTRSDGQPEVIDAGALPAAKGKPLSLRIFIDRSVVEAYANGQCVVAGQVNHGDIAADAVAVFTEGQPVRARSIECWEMAPSNPW